MVDAFVVGQGEAEGEAAGVDQSIFRFDAFSQADLNQAGGRLFFSSNLDVLSFF